MTVRLRIDHKIMKEVDDLLKNSKKIQAIKLVRSETRAGLRQAKVACDHRHAELTGKKFPNNTPEAIEYIKNWQSRGYSGYVTEKSDVADN